MKNPSMYFACLVAFTLFFVQAALCIPSQISYQGRLTDANGNPAPDNVYSLKFAIYDAATGGDQLWTTLGFVPIQVQNGMFWHLLGSTNGIPDSLSKYDSLWLGITVGLDAEMTPRTRLVSSLYSFKSQLAQLSDTARHSLDKTISASELTAGTLDTARYSAYEDLVNENKIGSNPDQVAQGDHTHSNHGTEFFVDSSYQSMTIPGGHVEVTFRTITIPGGTISSFFRIYTTNFADCQYLHTDMYINNQYVSQGDGYRTVMVLTGSRASVDLYNVNGFWIQLNPSLPFEIKITASVDPGPCSVNANYFVLEYGH